MSSIHQTLTIETRLPHSLLAEQAAVLSEYADIFSRAGRHYLTLTQQARKAKLVGQKLPPPISKPAFMREHGLTGRQFNAVKVTTEGMIESRLENLPNYIAQCGEKMNGLKQRHKKNTDKIERLLGRDPAADTFKLTGSLRGFEQRIDRLGRSKASFQHQLKHKLSSICFGSRRLFRKQFDLAANGYASHAEWRADWRAARSSQFFVLGSSDEAGGCQGCTLLPGTDGTWTLRLRLPEAMVEQHGQYLYLTNIEFRYRPELIAQAVASNALRREQAAAFRSLVKTGTAPLDDDGRPIKEAAYLSPYGQALSYRFVNDDRGWRILVSAGAEFEAAEADFRSGAVGVDFNAGFVSVAEVNGRGQKLALTDLRYDRLDATSKQNATAMQFLAIEVVTLAKSAGKPIVIETLDFRRKKGGLQKREQAKSAYHQMLSSLSYAAFRRALHMQCLKQGVAMVTVNPAYTSLLGRLKYTRETDQNTHQAAAWVIARRGMGLRERIPAYSRIPVLRRLEIYSAPEDAAAGHFEALSRVQSHFTAWFRKLYHEIRSAADPAGLSVSFPDVPL